MNLPDLVQELTRQVEHLRLAIDDLTTEIQHEARQKTFKLISMPKDPLSDDWEINRVNEEQVRTLREELQVVTLQKELF